MSLWEAILARVGWGPLVPAIPSWMPVETLDALREHVMPFSFSEQLVAAVPADAHKRPAALATMIALWFAINWVGGAASYILLPPYRRLKLSDKMGWNCRIPSCVHAALAAYVSYVSILENRLYLATAGGQAVELKTMVTVSFSWMLSDLINEAYCGLRGVGYRVAKDNLGHHFAGIALMVLYLWWVDTRGFSGSVSFYTALFLSTEVTTPILNIRYWTLKGGLGDTVIPTILGLILLSMFIVFRVVVCGILVVGLAGEPVLPPLLRQTGMFVGLGFFLLNCYWSSLMMKKVIELFLPPRAHAKRA
mmetsp:Transcript_3629/g.13033  ORF Transcript_3629/g.13033 Transcript_3629/m.13033 type:complete len:306 (+) Transcript_3629:155-1072(+)